MTAAARHAARERQRRCRERQRKTLAVYQVVVGRNELNFLVRTHWLGDGDTTNPELVGSAISRMLADAAEK